MTTAQRKQTGIVQSRQRSYNRAAAILSGLCLLGCLRLTATRLKTRQQPAPPPSEFAAKLAEARRSGLVVDMAQMQAPLPPESQNAAPIYVLITQKLKGQPILAADEKAVFYLPFNPSKADIANAREVLSRQKDLLWMIHQAAGKPDCVFTRDWTQPDPAAISFAEYASIRDGARLLGAEGRVMADRGDTIGAVNNVALGFQMARHAESEHDEISYLEACRVNNITLSSLRKIICQCNGDPKVALAARQAVEKSWRTPDLAASLKGEITMKVGEIGFMRQFGPATLALISGRPVTPGLSHMDSRLWNRYVDSNGALILDEMTRAVAAAGLPNPAALDAIRSEDADFDKMISNPAPNYIVATALLGTVGHAVRDRAQDEAAANEIIAGAAVLCYKSAHGALPTTLDQAIMPVPIDPFDGKPLRFKRESNGFVVYSVGPNGKFDGGTPTVDPGTNQRYLFRYPNPPSEKIK